MHVVVLHIPRLWKHPVAPIDEPPDWAACKLGAMESAVDTNLSAVATMANVMANHGPANTDSSAQAESRDRVPRKHSKPSGSQADSVQDVRPGEHLLHVLHIFLSLVLSEFLLHRADLVSPRFQVQVLTPFGDLLQRHTFRHKSRSHGHGGSCSHLEERRCLSRRHSVDSLRSQRLGRPENAGRRSKGSCKSSIRNQEKHRKSAHHWFRSFDGRP
mmetsp:Transcript_30554/g.98425  ORF Transcript_30554/g.98425 Transcript_30554/m.98425 type:complete len:215 (-) Transcript_30554:6-650(-)